MALTPEQMQCLRDIGEQVRRDDPALHRALAAGHAVRPRWSIWCIVYLAGSTFMLTLGAVAGASLVSIVLWLCLVSAGSAVVRAQDRAQINR